MSPMLHRTQIQLTDAQDRALRRIARREGISLSEAIRRCLDRALLAEEPAADARYQGLASLAGAFEDEASDVSARHDRYLDEAFAWPKQSS